jgi:hypothetical protein
MIVSTSGLADELNAQNEDNQIQNNLLPEHYRMLYKTVFNYRILAKLAERYILQDLQEKARVFIQEILRSWVSHINILKFQLMLSLLNTTFSQITVIRKIYTEHYLLMKLRERTPSYCF